MIFSFGSSRSWAAREARKKARQMRQKKRRTLIRNTLSIFSLVVLSISIWSLTKIKSTETATGLRGKASKFSIDKTAAAGNKRTLEMPRPPVEPPAPEYMKKPVNASELIDGKSENMQRADRDTTQEERHSAKTNSYNGDSSDQSGSHEGSGNHSYGKVDSSGVDNSRDKSVDRVSRSDTAVNGMAQQATWEDDNSEEETTNEGNDQSENTASDDSASDVQKEEEMEEVLDSEEGGKGPTIVVKSRDYSSILGNGDNGNGGRRAEVNNKRSGRNRPTGDRQSGTTERFEEQERRNPYLTEKGNVRDSGAMEPMPNRDSAYLNMERGLDDRKRNVLIANAYSGAGAAGRHPHDVGSRENVGMGGGKSMYGAWTNSHRVYQYPSGANGTQTLDGTSKKRDISIEGNNYRGDGGSVYHENDTPGETDRPFSASGIRSKNSVGMGMAETRGSQGSVSNIGSHGVGRANDMLYDSRKTASDGARWSALGMVSQIAVLKFLGWR